MSFLRTSTYQYPTLDDVEAQVADSRYSALAKKDTKLLYPASWPPWRISLHVFIVTNKPFERFIGVVIIINCILLALDDPNDDESDWLQRMIYYSDFVFGFIFFVEMIMKMFGLGLVGTKTAYFRNGWNVLDFLIVVSTWYGLLARLVPAMAVFGDTGSSAIRAFRLLRPLRSISTLTSLRILVKSIFISLPKLMDVFLLYLVFLVMVGVAGVQLFKGSLKNHCVRGDGLLFKDDTYTCSRDGGGFFCPYNYTCIPTSNPNYGKTSFDHIFAAILTIFTVVTLEGWSDIMYSTADATSNASALYFTSVVVLGSFFIFNLALVIITEAFEENVSTIQNEVRVIRTALQESHATPLSPKLARGTANNTTFGRLPVSPRLGTGKGTGGAIPTNSRRGGFGSNQPSSIPMVAYVQERIVSTRSFFYFQLTLIIVNMVLLSCVYRDMPQAMADVLHVLNICINVLFLIELILRILASNLYEFFTRPMNVFDFVIIIVSFVVEVLDLRLNFSAIRTVRVFRIIQLATVFEGLNRWCSVIVRSVRSASMLGCLIFLLVFVYALLGAQMFGGKLCDTYDLVEVKAVSIGSTPPPPVINVTNNASRNITLTNLTTTLSPSTVSPSTFKSVCTQKPRLNFDTFGQALLTSFVLLSGEGWSSLMYMGMSAIGDLGSLYYVSYYFIGNYLMLNLFIAVLLHNRKEEMEEEQLSKMQVSNQSDESLQQLQLGRSIYLNMPDQPQSKKEGTPVSIPKKSDDSFGEVVGESKFGRFNPLNYWGKNIQPENSLFIFHESHKFRVALKTLEESRMFEGTVLSVIVVSAIALCLDDPIEPPDSSISKVLDTIDIVVSSFFVIECAINVVAYGFILHKESYLRRSGWNVFDFIITVFSFFSIIIPSHRYWLALPKMIRVLRPLRLIQRFKGLQLVVDCVVDSLPSIGNVLVISMLILFVFAIIGVQMFQGLFNACTASTWGDNTYGGHQIYDKKTCLDVGLQWTPHPMNFDNIARAFLSLYSIASLESWTELMFLGIDARDANLAPVRDANPHIAAYFVIFVSIMGFFIVKLFVGVLIDTYYEEKTRRKSSQGLFLSDDQQEWIKLYKHTIRFVSPPVYASYAKGSIRDKIQIIVTHPLFDVTALALVALNTIVMATEHADESPGFELFQNIMNIFFIALFLTESMLRLIALGRTSFLEDRWNIFDLVVTIFSLATVILDFLFGVSLLASTFRIARIVRFVRVARAAHGIGVLLRTLFMSLPSLINVSALLLLLFLVFAVFGVQLFGLVRRHSVLTKDANFENFGAALLTLFRVMTGENWNGLMYDLMVLEPACSNKLNDCGTPATAGIFFFVYVLCGQYVMINLFIAVILDNFSQASKDADYIVQEDDIGRFRTLWAKFDPDDNRIMDASNLCVFLTKLGPPLCRRLTSASLGEIRKYVMSLNVPVRRGMVMQQDVLDRLLRSLFSVDLPKETEEYLRKKSDERFRAKQRDRKMTMDKNKDAITNVALSEDVEMMDTVGMTEVIAAMRIQSFFRGRRARHMLLRAIAKEKAKRDGVEAAEAWLQPLIQKSYDNVRVKHKRGNYRSVAYHLI